MPKIAGTTLIEVTDEDLFKTLQRSVMGWQIENYEVDGKVYKDDYDPRSGNCIRTSVYMEQDLIEPHLELIRAFVTIRKYLERTQRM